MHIQSIEIKNFRRFAEYRCDFDPRFTLLMGENGVGKTSLLRAISLTMSQLLGRVGGIGVWEIADADVHRIDTLDPAGERWRTPVYPSSIELAIAIARQRVRVRHQRSYEGPSKTTVDQESLVETLFGRWFRDPNVSEGVPLFAYIGAIISLSTKGLTGPIRQPFETKKEVWARAGSDSIKADAIAEWIQYNELRTLQEGQTPLVYRVARKAILSAIHAEDINYVVRDGQLMLRYANEGWQPFHQLSDGQRRVAAMFCELAIRCAALNSHLGEQCIEGTTGVVAIDELDLHLHPNWQRSIVGDLLRVFPGLQFIAASHSPFLLQAAFEHGKVLDVASGQFVEPSDPSIEDIAESVMHVDQPQRGRRFLELKQAAQEFYELLETKPSTPGEEAALKARLDVAMAQFANDPASAAWLEQRRLAAGH